MKKKNRQKGKEAQPGSTLFQMCITGFCHNLNPSEEAFSSQLHLKVYACFRAVNGDLRLRFLLKSRSQNTDLICMNGKGAKSLLTTSPMSWTQADLWTDLFHLGKEEKAVKQKSMEWRKDRSKLPFLWQISQSPFPLAAFPASKHGVTGPSLPHCPVLLM